MSDDEPRLTWARLTMQQRRVLGLLAQTNRCLRDADIRMVIPSLPDDLEAAMRPLILDGLVDYLCPITLNKYNAAGGKTHVPECWSATRRGRTMVYTRASSVRPLSGGTRPLTGPFAPSQGAPAP